VLNLVYGLDSQARSGGYEEAKTKVPQAE
jgi:hypothetical protein